MRMGFTVISNSTPVVLEGIRYHGYPFTLLVCLINDVCM